MRLNVAGMSLIRTRDKISINGDNIRLEMYRKPKLKFEL
jgi:hypothetical protein